MLVIVDVQKCFPASEIVLPAVVSEVRQAKRRKESIVLVQYGVGARSLGRLTRELKGYKYLRVNKHNDDGGGPLFTSLMRCMFDNRLNVQNINLSSVKSIKICGVNTSACVIKTVRSLSFLRIPIKVLSGACANNLGHSKLHDNVCHNMSLRRMNKWKNVQVI